MAFYRFFEFELDPNRYELRRQGRNLRLENIPMDLLLLLVGRGGDLISREEIIEHIWGKDVFVDSEAGINTAIRKIRQALHDDHGSPRFIQTVVGRGYRFLAPVSLVEESQADSNAATTNSATIEDFASGDVALRKSWILRAATAMIVVFVLVLVAANVRGTQDWLLGRSRPAAIHSLAVLPLEDLSLDPGEEYFADGMTDELITDLAQFGELRVISRTSAMRYKGKHESLPEIARELNVDAIVEGTVERSGGQVRVRAQLIRAADDRHIWSESFERKIQDVLALQTELASSIARQIGGQLTSPAHGRVPGNRQVSPDVYEAYLRGRYLWNKRTVEDVKKAMEYFRQAIEKDENYAPAYSGLADTLILLGPREEAKSTARKALELDPLLADAHTSLGQLLFIDDRDWVGAEREFNRAIELNPSYATAHHWFSGYLMAMGRLPQAEAEAKRAESFDPLSPIIGSHLAGVYYNSRQYEKAIQQCQKTLELHPNFEQALSVLSTSQIQQGNFKEAIPQLQLLVKQDPTDSESIADLAYAQAMSGRKTEAQKALKLLDQIARVRRTRPYERAIVYMGLGERDEALKSLEKADEVRSYLVLFANVDPYLDPLQSDPRFQALMRHIGLPH
jgi:TolB-like protein/DNA-binding winged helix-turn-helix (wHTH) protein/Flp pilus assembly protein TadD